MYQNVTQYRTQYVDYAKYKPKHVMSEFVRLVSGVAIVSLSAAHHARPPASPLNIA